MYILAPFILQNLKKILRANPELWGCVIFAPKMAHLSWANFFWYKLLWLLSSTHWLFSLFKIFKKFLQQIQSYENVSFLVPNGSFAPNKKFVWKKLLISFSSTYWPLSFCKIFKKFLKPIQIYEDVPFLGPKYPNLS